MFSTLEFNLWAPGWKRTDLLTAIEAPASTLKHANVGFFSVLGRIIITSITKTTHFSTKLIIRVSNPS